MAMEQGPPASRRSAAMPRVAALIALTMLMVLWGDVLLGERISNTVGSSGYSGTAAIVIGALALPIALGLWLRQGWGWWVGLVAGIWQLISHLLYLIVQLASGEQVGLIGWLIALLLAVFLVVLLLPATRNSCLGRRTGSADR